MGEQLEQVAKAQGLIERGPIAFLAALLALYAIFITVMWVRSRLSVEKLQRAHAKQLAEKDSGHAERVEELHRDALERAIKLEHIVQGMLRLVTFGGEVKPGTGKRRRKPRTNPGLPLEVETPTLVLEEGEPDADDE